MDRLVSKYLSMCLVVILSVSVLLFSAEPSNAQTVPNPAVPEFSIKFLNSSYTETTTNPYTGLEETEQITNASIQITITNQQYTYSDYQIYYNIRSRPHFEGNWTELYAPMERPTAYKEDGFYWGLFVNEYAVPQSNSSYTIITFDITPTAHYQATGYDVALGVRMLYYGIPYGSQLDFQVEAQVGHPSQTWVSGNSFIHTEATGYYMPAVAYDTSSAWSNSKTASIGETSSSSVSPSPTVPELPTLAILSLFIVIPVIIAIITRKKNSLKAYN